MTKHIMLDLETMGTTPGSAITQIGAVVFDPATEKFGATFYRRICLRSCVEIGMTMDPDTVIWWLKQSDAARAEFAKPSIHIAVALRDFKSFLVNHLDGDVSPCIWGNGAGFDNILLADAYRLYGYGSVWPHYADRCFRTLKSEFSGIAKPATRTLAEYADAGLICDGEFVATAHNALWDAITQAHWAMHILKSLREVV